MFKSSFIFKWTLLIYLLSASFPAKAAPEGVISHSVESLARSPIWHRLLHYRTNLIGQLKSEAAGPDFFFSPEGKTDPLKELLASKTAFETGTPAQIGKLKQSPQCAFPQRYRFLKRELNLQVRDLPCPLLDDFLARFRSPNSVTLVFSSAYPDNPASMFGHTFLRINASDSKSSELLDQGISFSASVSPDESPLIFYWLGMTGGYRGEFSLLPYYVKVNEYNHAEARDLWEYELNLSPDETLVLLRHLWELETNTWIDYYFFDQNCAFQLLAMLEVAKPDWDLTRTPPWVIPAETLKRVAHIPGAVKKISFRPSYRKTLVERLSHLSPVQKQIFTELDGGALKPEQVNDSQVLDALGSKLLYEKQKSEGNLPEPRKKLINQTLSHRSDLRSDLGIAPELNSSGPLLDLSHAPHLGHDAGRFGIAGGFVGEGGRESAYQEVHWRSAYHDLMNDDLGFLKYSQVEFPNLTLRYYSMVQKFSLEKLEFLNLYSMSPWVSFEHKVSWGLNLDYYSPKDFGCLACHAARFQMKGGMSLLPFGSYFGSDTSLFYLLGVLDAEAGTSLTNFFRFGPGVETAFLYNPWEPYKLRLGYTICGDLFQSARASFFYQASADQSYSLSQDWEFRASYTFGRDWNESKLQLSYYF